jgi:hypothetical protein
MFHNFLAMFIYLIFSGKSKVSKCDPIFFQNQSKCFADTSLHIIKCLKCKMFHNFLGMFHLPDIFRKIQSFKMWFDLFQNHSKCFVDTYLHIMKCSKCKMFHTFFWECSIYLPFFRKSKVSKCDLIFFSKPVKMLCRYFPTHNQVFKVQNVP